ncbi:hypothetical protein [Massilia sp. NR 4-1]|uniref:hypothetical protein n=1 Tax=Massilia sp. NR 4-1 TaxID=1678028 RepID=UPI00067B68B0|nr:hypothetical protein [Massilia sp. NR 4-1]AKU22158.1 hypothetical protein ACZ75_12465 [Massilia sp. NR 4-1]
MSLRKLLLAPMGKLLALTAPADQFRGQQETSMIKYAQMGLRHFLGLPQEQAFNMAQAGLGGYKRLLQRGTLPADAPQLPPVATEVARLLQHGSCMLALPFNLSTLQLLLELPASLAQRTVIIESPTIINALRLLGSQNKAPSMMPPRDVIKRVKAARTDGSAPVLYISFPELHVRGNGTTASLNFLGKSCTFSLLEPLLYCFGLQTMLTLAPNPSRKTSLQLQRFEGAETDGPNAGKALALCMGWMSGHLQDMARTFPELTLAWPHLYRASGQFRALERNDKLKQLEAYFDAWRQAGPELDAQSYAFIKSRLTEMRNSH